jgi:hypothetical protein
MKKSWSQFFVYAASLAISLVLNMYQPNALDVLCTPLPVKHDRNPDSPPTIDRTPSNQRSLDQEK